MRDDFDYSGEQRFTIHQMTRLTRTIWRVLNDEFMGFTRSSSKPGTFAFCVRAMSKERTLRDALKTGSTFYGLVTDDIETEILEQGDHAIIDIRFQRPELDPDYYFEDFWMVIWHRLASWLTGLRIPLQYVNFTQARPPHSPELNYMFPGVLDFGTPSSQLAFDARHLELPINRSAREVDRFLARSPFYILSIPGSEGMLHGTIVSMLTPEDNGALDFPSIEDIAGQLGCSGTTLRRRLGEESSSYSKIKDELRRNVAYKMLADQSLSIEEVALAAGYSTASPFIRAFNQWTGTSPLQYRQKIRSQ